MIDRYTEDNQPRSSTRRRCRTGHLWGAEIRFHAATLYSWMSPPKVRCPGGKGRLETLPPPSHRLDTVPLKDDAIRLPDGRRLAYTAWGARKGATVFFFHGTPHSRLWCPDETVTASSGVRLLTVD